MNFHSFSLLKTLVFSALIGLSAEAQMNPKLDEGQKVKSFPDQCIGTWKGMMYIYAYGNLRDSVQVDYIMRRDPKSAHTFLLDEGDGVVLTNYLTGTKLYSNFETEGILLGSSYEFIGGNLVFEVTSGKKLNEAEESGVTNFSVDFVQRVVLKKMR
jgi:hypothetical protein